MALTPEHQIIGRLTEENDFEDIEEAIRAGIRAAYAEIKRELRERARPDSWDVPCVYVESFIESMEAKN